MAEIKIFDSRRGSKKAYQEAIKYLTNAEGELKRQGRQAISVDDLPTAAQQAYKRFVRDKHDDDLVYLVETNRGYGVAITFEYDRSTAINSGLPCDIMAFPHLFACLLCDAKTIADDSMFQDAAIFATEYLGYGDCHELIVVLPADITKKDFRAKYSRLLDYAYETCFEEHDKAQVWEKSAAFCRDVRHGKYAGVDDVLAQAETRSRKTGLSNSRQTGIQNRQLSSSSVVAKEKIGMDRDN